ncbi:hypothetical protein D9613_007563 [Agrocybe pediades]|uniref:RNA helicase n=1 Tax=Agrocybe pediades TaxID=84607 RepID=A0A8H4QLX4_9AGAR|nr:hypothetical protein D9613_007563 [Agrocybe pediades]
MFLLDRANVSIVVRTIHNPMNTFSDMDFVIPPDITSPDEIPLTFIYADKINDGVGIEERLTKLLPENLRNQGLIRPYSAAYSPEYREELMCLFKAGIVRVLICTDAAGMGCNISNIDVVVQWKLPTCVSSFVQRAGRAARDPGRTGIAVLLVEKSAFEADISKINDGGTTHKSARKGVRQSLAHPKAPKGYAVKHGVQRGAHDGLADEHPGSMVAVPLDSQSPDEGLYSLVQTGKCRREVLTEIYSNETPEPTAPCCDLCDPSLLNRTRPGKPEPATRKASVKTGILNTRVKLALQEWRRKIRNRDFEESLLDPSVILKDELVDVLSSVGPIGRLNELEKVAGEDWPWFSEYGNELLEEMRQLAIAPMQSKVCQRRLEKRAAPATCATGEGNSEDGGGQKKRAATSTHNVSTRTATVGSVNHSSGQITTVSGQQSNFIAYPSPMASHYPSLASSSSTSPLYASTPYYYYPTYVHHYPQQYPSMQPYLYQHPYHQTPSRNPGPASYHDLASSNSESNQNDTQSQTKS